MTAARPVRQWPEPGRGWIAWCPSTWSCGPDLWTDLARCRLEGHRPYRELLPDLDLDGVDDLLYVPPVRGALRAERDRRVGEWAATGVPVVVQVQPGEPGPIGVRTVVDLLPALADGALEQLGEIPAGAWALWPTIPGITDRPELQEEGCEILAARGVETLQVLVPEIPSPLRRRLAEHSEDAFDSLFHAGTTTEREMVRIAWRHGLAPFPRRRPAGTPRTVRNRELAEALALVAELTIRLGDPMAEAQAYLRAARGADAGQRDLAALVREGNLRVLDWIDSRAAEVVEELVQEGRSRALEDLRARYVAG